jgi:hypothetical protein
MLNPAHGLMGDSAINMSRGLEEEGVMVIYGFLVNKANCYVLKGLRYNKKTHLEKNQADKSLTV